MGFPDTKVVGLAINIMLKHNRRMNKEHVLELLEDILQNAEGYLENKDYGPIARELIGTPTKTAKAHSLNDAKPFRIYGSEHIEHGAMEQMRTAMSLPVTVSGALMPDAHHGYGLPIGGVLATNNAIIPYAVGVDIGCRMCMTVHRMNPDQIERNASRLKNILKDNTRFGQDTFSNPKEHPILERSEFDELKHVRALKDKAWSQIGTSGGGNHFVEFGSATITEANNGLGLPPGEYLAVLSHSGSRGMGARIAQYYTDLAMETCRLPKGAAHLAWLGLDTDAGREYWMAMNLAGDYATACHDQIHDRISRALSSKPLAKVDNHHNFAWKQTLANGQEVIVHRKGATPASRGEVGIIPGSMTAPGFIVRGKGNPDSLNSASHGAGRKMSRGKAKASINKKEMMQYLKRNRVTLIGGGPDEAPQAYKDITKVMNHQQDLVEVLGTFQPKLVRMCGR